MWVCAMCRVPSAAEGIMVWRHAALRRQEDPATNVSPGVCSGEDARLDLEAHVRRVCLGSHLKWERWTASFTKDVCVQKKLVVGKSMERVEDSKALVKEGGIMIEGGMR